MKSPVFRCWISANRPGCPGVWLLIAGLLLGWSGPALAQDTNADRILGSWLTQNGQSKILITRSNELYLGTLVWLSPKVQAGDTNSAGQPGVSLIGTEILTGFNYEGDSTWGGGKLFAPERNKHLDARLSLSGQDKLEVRVSAGLFHEVVTWTRVKEGS